MLCGRTHLTLGSLQKYPGFADRIHEGLVDIFGEKGRNVVTYHAEDGSGIGSAIVAGAFASHRSRLLCFTDTRPSSNDQKPEGS